MASPDPLPHRALTLPMNKNPLGGNEIIDTRSALAMRFINGLRLYLPVLTRP